MGRKLDALLEKNFKTAKFKLLVTLALSRLVVLKSQWQIRCSYARSDVVQLLQLGHHNRALLRVEQVIKEHNMLDVFVMYEGYCNLLIKRVHLMEHDRKCPKELKEAISGIDLESIGEENDDSYDSENDFRERDTWFDEDTPHLGDKQ